MECSNPDCTNSLEGMRLGSRYCSSDCRRSVTRGIRPFVGLDGEGTQKEFVLLASSTGRWIGRKAGLSTEECLDYLLALPRRPSGKKGGGGGKVNPIYVWFAFDYDINMILKDIPLRGENSIENLKTDNTIIWRGYKITYIRRKIFRIRRGSRVHSSVDVWGFFQSSFENALREWSIEVAPIIAEGKAAREQFYSWNLDRLRDYNNAELIALAELAEKLREAAAPLELPIQSWHGPAALAGAWLRKNNVKQFMEDTREYSDTDNSIPNPTYNPIPDGLLDVASRAYFGGRIDIQGYGIVDPVYHYDIISAYPAGIAALPDLSLLSWRHKKGAHCGRLYVSRIRWKIPSTYWAPFPWRSKDGSIRYPLSGEGWYWNYEVEIAVQKYGSEFFDVIETWYPEGELRFPFHDLIHDTFQYRQQLKKQGNSSHRAIRLILNSLYGKFAQSVGNARYRNLIWAGLITSYTRAQLMAPLSDSVVCTMTDSLWSREPLDLEIGVGLGEWEEGDEIKLYLAEAGLYSAVRPDNSTHVWQRGFDKRNPVDIPGLVIEWLKGNPVSHSYEVTRFVGFGLALQSPKFNWRTWQKFDRVIHPVPLSGTTKRLPIFPLDSDYKLTQFQPLQLRPRDNDSISAPYKNLTQDELLIIQRMQDDCEEE